MPIDFIIMCLYYDVYQINPYFCSKELWLLIGKEPATLSNWCTNTCQPSLEMMTIAKLLKVDLNDLVRFEELAEIYNNEESSK